MANYRKIHVKIWSDPDFERLPRNAKLLFVYLLTNSHRNESALYSLTRSRMGFETSMTDAEIRAALEELREMVVYEEVTEQVWVKNAVYYQELNPNCIKSIAYDLAQSPSTELVAAFREHYKGHINFETVRKPSPDGSIDIDLDIGVSGKEKEEEREKEKEERGPRKRRTEPPRKPDHVDFAHHVRMRPVDHATLVKKYGQSRTQRAIEELENWKVDKIEAGLEKDTWGDDYRKILKWVMNKVYELERKKIFTPTPDVKYYICPDCEKRMPESQRYSHNRVGGCPKYVPPSKESLSAWRGNLQKLTDQFHSPIRDDKNVKPTRG